MAKDKTNNFLKAIKKHAKAQKSAMENEVKQLKSERLKEAEEKAKRDSKNLIKQKLSEKRNEQTAILAAKTQEGQRKLFIERTKMTEEVFAQAENKLKEFTKTPEYIEKLKKSADRISALFGENSCVIYLSESDIAKADELKPLFRGEALFEADKTIRIGGVKGYCAKMGIIADETMDSKLEAQREWFCENAALSVL